MKIEIERTVLKKEEAPVRTAGGRTPAEISAEGVQWHPVGFVKPMRIGWNWEDLLQDATAAGENLNLAVAGLVLSNEVEAAAVRGEAVLRQLGFGEIQSGYYLLSTETRNEISKPARTFGHKAVVRDGETFHVICAVFKGTTTLPDTVTDVKSVLDGFYGGGRSCADSLREYVGLFEGADRDHTILFITGHSLGASTANVVGRLSRAFARDEHTFVYTFASPNYETEGEWNNGKDYPNFRYFTNTDDVVPKVPLRLPPRFFSKIGREHAFCYASLEKDRKARFLRVYRYFRNIGFEDDTDLSGLGLRETESLAFAALKNHLCNTYMSFLLSELADEVIDRYLPG